jgi:hypothetical protein
VQNCAYNAGPYIFQACLEAVQNLSSDDIKIDAVSLLCSKFHGLLKEYLEPMGDNPMIPLLKYQPISNPGNQMSPAPDCSIETLFTKAKEENSPEATACLLYAILSAKVDSTFHKINVHAAMTPAVVKKHFEPIFDQARYFQESKNAKSLIVTVRVCLCHMHMQVL